MMRDTSHTEGTPKGRSVPIADEEQHWIMREEEKGEMKGEIRDI